LLHGRRWAALALEDTDRRKAQYLRDGVVFIA